MNQKTILAAICLLLSTAACSNDQNSPQNPASDTPSAKSASAPDAQILFQANCSSCHKLTEDATGPALAGALARWNNERARLKSFIRNPAAALNAGDPRAKELMAKWSTMMLAYPNLTEQELDALLTLMQ